MLPMRRAFILLAITVFAYQFSSGMNRSIQNNFFVEELALRADQMGLLTTVREFPGFLMILIAAAGLRLLAPPHFAALALVVMGIGYGLYSRADSFGSLLVFAVIGSVGFHSWMPLSNTLSLAIATKENAGRVQGRVQSVGWAGMVLSMILMYFSVTAIGYRAAFVLSGVVLAAGALAVIRFPAALAVRPLHRIVLRRRYALFYVLNFLDGCRSEVFLAFGVFLLVQQYKVDVRTITLMLIASSLINMVTSQYVGRLIDTIGERRTLTFSYLVHFVTFLGFALIHDGTVAIILYVIYNFLMLFHMGVNSYLKRIADPQDVGPSMAVAITSTHVSSMVIPLLGGALWQRFGFEVPFLLGSVFILVSVVATQRLPAKARRTSAAAPA